MSAPKILHVFPSFEVGGSQRRLVSYLNGSDAELEHHIYAMDGCYSASESIKGFIKSDVPAGAIQKGSTLNAIKACKEQLRRVKPDLLVTYNWGSIEWNLANLREQFCPMLHIQDGFAEDEHATEKWPRKIIRLLAYRRCSAVVVPSNQLAHLAKKSWRIRDNKLLYIPNGIDVDTFKRSKDLSLLSDFDVKPTDLIIGTIARLKPEKNIGRLIEAFSKIENDFPHAKLVIVGDGIGMAALKMLAERICVKDNVIFTGMLEKPENIVPAFDIFALSSDTEQMPISVLEAMAAGKPVISTDAGDVKTMVSDLNTNFIEGMDAGILATHLATFLSDEKQRTVIGSANQKMALERYSLSHMIKTYDDLFLSLIK